MKETLPTLTCSNCSHENLEDAKFCQNCGQSLARICTNCNTPNEAEAKFCRSCGNDLDIISPSIGETRLSSLQQAAPESLREKIRLSSSQIEGERKPVTILFTDIVGSTAIAEKLDPEVWKEIVSGTHRRVGEAVYRYEGTIAQLLGDGVLAFFGAPITHEDDPIRALRAAMDIQESVKAYSQELAGIVDDFQMRIGINTGIVVIGEIGIDMHVEYLAIGDAVNVAARLQSAAKPGEIVLSEQCARLVSAEFELKDLGEITAKGKAEPLQAFELISVKAEPETGRGIEGFPTPYVGRAREVEELQSALLSLCAGHGQIVTVIGEAGIGKTRHLEEVKAIIHEDEGDRQTTPISPSSIRWLEGRALSYGGSLSYWTITQLLLADLGLSDSAPQVEIKVAMRRRAKELFGEERADEVLPYLAHLLGLRGEVEIEKQIQSLDGETLKKQTLKSVSDYFGQVADEGPTVMVFEDVHWSDPSSLEALEGLLALTDRVPLMILMLMRVDRDHGSWGVKFKAETDFPHRTTEVHLRRLSEGDSSSLLEQLLGETKLPEEIWRTIMERSEGNPFYLEEVIRHLMEQALIVQDEDGWRAAEELEEMGIPDTLQGVLLARIDRLEDDVRRTLQMASVIGKSFLYRILETISEAEMQLDKHLSQLQRVDLVREKARIPELEYIFKHALTQEAAYNSLLHERRKVFHLKVGEALEELFPDRVDEFSGLMAHHFEAAESHKKAVDYLQRAGDQTRLTYAHQETIDFYERALVILKEQEMFDRAARTLMKLGLTYQNTFEFKLAREAFDRGFVLWQREPEIKPTASLHDAPHALRLTMPVPTTLDTALSIDLNTEEYIKQLFSCLVEFSPELEVLPDVAHSWEVFEDGLKYVFHLREDVFWSDGTSVNAKDFEFSIKRSLDPDIAHPMRAKLLYDVVGARAFHQGETSDSECVGVRALDDLTFLVELEMPVADFLYKASTMKPVPRHVVEKFGLDWIDPENIVTNGPFRLESWHSNQRITLSRNPEYHGRFSGNLQRVEVLHYEGIEESAEMYEKDKIDVREIANKELDRVRTLHADEYVSGPLFNTDGISFNVARPPFTDRQVRQAFVLSADREARANVVLKGAALPATGGVVPSGVPGHTEGIGLPFDPDLAREIIAKAGYSQGHSLPMLDFIVREIGPASEYLVAQWHDILGAEIKLIESKTFSREEDMIRQMKPHMCGVGWFGHPDPYSFLQVWFDALSEWRNEEFIELIEAARCILDQKKRMSMYQQAEQILVKEAPFMPLTYGREHMLVKPWVRKYPISPLGTRYFKDVIIEPH